MHATSGDPDGELRISALTVKLPTFWTTEAETWFIQAESQFNIRGITVDSTKYDHVIAALDQTSASRILGLIKNPPQTDKYATLKKPLLQIFGQSKRAKVARLLDYNKTGDIRPSVIASELMALAERHDECPLVLEIFLRQLPEQIRLALALNETKDLQDLASLADELWEENS